VNNLIAGGGQTLQFCQHSTGNGGASDLIKDNRFARRVCSGSVVSDVQRRGGFECSGSPNESISYFDAGAGRDGYFPRVGFFGLVREENLYGLAWEGNYWDDNLQPVHASSTGG
jgi:hypothetical protein